MRGTSAFLPSHCGSLPPVLGPFTLGGAKTAAWCSRLRQAKSRRRKGARTSGAGGSATRDMRIYGPWATCRAATAVAMPAEMTGEGLRQRQAHCSGCMARFTMTVARCAACHGEPLQCGGHDWDTTTCRVGLPTGQRPGQRKPPSQGRQLTLGQVWGGDRTTLARGGGGAASAQETPSKSGAHKSLELDVTTWRHL